MSECIEWNKAKNKAGYGITWFQGKWAYAHRAVVNALKGEVVRHSCDNPSCVNPEHLTIGTHQDNSNDMVDKGRQVKGERAGNSHLKEQEVLEIRGLQGKMSSRKVAAIFNCSKTNVLDIWRGYIWKHL